MAWSSLIPHVCKLYHFLLFVSPVGWLSREILHHFPLHQFVLPCLPELFSYIIPIWAMGRTTMFDRYFDQLHPYPSSVGLLRFAKILNIPYYAFLAMFSFSVSMVQDGPWWFSWPLRFFLDNILNLFASLIFVSWICFFHRFPPATSAPAVASGARGLKKPKGFVPTAPVYNFSAQQMRRAADAVDWRLTEAVTPIKNQGALEDWELDHPTDPTDHPNGLVEACQISPPDTPFIVIYIYIYIMCIYITCYNVL